MWASAITAYLHYLGFMVSFAALSVELFHFKKDMSLSEAKTVALADAVYGLSAATILITGILRVIYFGKGTDYYLNNPFFYTKISLFVLVSLFSLYPTFTFISWFKDFQNAKPPILDLLQISRISWLIKGELFGFILIPFFGAVMARMTGWQY